MSFSREFFLSDDDFIVSKTDKKGIITYCNSSFLEIVGLSVDKLLGKPHNIIRHEDMPKCVFKLLWSRIQDKKEVFAFVKNRSFKGGFYWVFANVTASLNNNGEIIGYYSVRRRANIEAVKFIEPVYRQLLEAEKSGGIQSSERLLNDTLNGLGLSYDEFVNALQRNGKI